MIQTEPRAEIIIAAHKPYWMPQDPMYIPLQMGAIGKEPIGYRLDSEGHSISEKNSSFCELTGLYWAWRNLSAEFVGLSHYRRHFTRKSAWYIRTHAKEDCVMTQAECEELLEDHDIILPKKRHYFIETLYSHYVHTHYKKPLRYAREILESITPEYREDFDVVMNQRSGYMFNMMVMRRDLVDQYCPWLFNILFALEQKVDTSYMSDFQKRYPGRISELLLNVWLHHQIRTGSLDPSRVCEVGFLFMEKEDWRKKGTAFLKAKFFGIKYSKSF